VRGLKLAFSRPDLSVHTQDMQDEVERLLAEMEAAAALGKAGAPTRQNVNELIRAAFVTIKAQTRAQEEQNSDEEEHYQGAPAAHLLSLVVDALRIKYHLCMGLPCPAPTLKSHKVGTSAIHDFTGGIPGL
jgi:hypothetical protein